MENIDNVEEGLLIREAQGGNHAAFEQLVHAHDQAVLGLALRLTGSQSDAQDIHQETFLKVYNKLASFRFECSFSTWIHRVVTNVCMDHLRRKRSRRQNDVIEMDVDAVSDDRPVYNPEPQLLRKELGVYIARALKRLSPRERMIFDLMHFQGLKPRTVSEILNSSEGSVKAGFFRATRKLRFQLGRYTNQSSIPRCGVQSRHPTAVLRHVFICSRVKRAF